MRVGVTTSGIETYILKNIDGTTVRVVFKL